VDDGEDQVWVSGESMGQADLINPKRYDGTWCFVCFPLGPYCYGFYEHKALGEDSFQAKGCLFVGMPLIPFTEIWDRVPGTNKYRKRGAKEEANWVSDTVCTGLALRVRLSQAPGSNRVAPVQSKSAEPLPIKEVKAKEPPHDAAAMAHIRETVMSGKLIQLRLKGARVRRGIGGDKVFRGYDRSRTANWIVQHLSKDSADPLTFRVEGGHGSCFLWMEGDPERKQLAWKYRIAREGQHVFLWNDKEVKPGIFRWIFHPDGTISPDPRSATKETKGSAGSLVMGWDGKFALLVKRGDGRALDLTPFGVAEEEERCRRETRESVEKESRKREEEDKERARLAAHLESERQEFARREAEMREEMQGRLEEERRRYEEAIAAKRREEEERLRLDAALKDAQSPGLHTAVNMVAGALANKVNHMFSKESKYAAVRLILGSPERSDLKECVGLEDPFECAELLKNPLKAMKQEWAAAGGEDDMANFEYVVRGTVSPDEYPAHVTESLQTGVYHGGAIAEGEFDTGHEGMDLRDFVNHEVSRFAGLQEHHVAAIRLYTSSSYPLYNQPMRNGVTPHPIRVTMYCLAEGLKMLRKVGAKTDPEGYAKTKYLWRGMKDREMDLEAFKARGGTELAPMSTTSSREIADSYAGVGQDGHASLLFRYTTKALSRGVLIDYLSLYPKEKEFLYPPLTSLTYDDRSAVMVEGNVTVVPVDPQMA